MTGRDDMTAPSVVVLDYGSGNLRSAERALARAGALVVVTSSAGAAREADGLVVPGVGAYAACMAGLSDVDGAGIVRDRLAAGRPVLGICVGMQVLFEAGVEHGERTPGLGILPGVVAQLPAERLPHMGWNTVSPAPGSALFAGAEDERFYFVHSFAVQTDIADAAVTWASHGGPFVAAMEAGPLWATQFHPEKSGDAGARLLSTWVRSLAPVPAQ